MLTRALKLVEASQNLSMDMMAEAIGEIMAGQGSEDEITRLLVALHEKGETVEEVAGAARAMRERMTPIRTKHLGLLDTCGTGGDGSRTFNISTAAALVAAAAGVPVAKHGNRGITSRSGSADVLTALGVNVEAVVECVEACLDELGICFCFAPLLHGAMKHVAAIRKKIAAPTIFNILGPLVNPAAAEFQLLGVGRAALQPLLAEAMVLLGTRRTIVVHGCDGLDEVTLAGTTHVMEASGGLVTQYDWTPADFDLEPTSKEELLVNDPAESAAMIRNILAGRHGPARDIVLANAAAALYTTGRAQTLRAGVSQAAAALDAGNAMQLLERLAERSHR